MWRRGYHDSILTRLGGELAHEVVGPPGFVPRQQPLTYRVSSILSSGEIAYPPRYSRSRRRASAGLTF
jgi:hypothetical protein